MNTTTGLRISELLGQGGGFVVVGCSALDDYRFLKNSAAFSMAVMGPKKYFQAQFFLRFIPE